jgi:hypothetical protein
MFQFLSNEQREYKSNAENILKFYTSDIITFFLSENQIFYFQAYFDQIRYGYLGLNISGTVCK